MIRPRNAPSMSSFKINITLDPFKAIRIIEEHIVANFPLDLRAQKVKLTIKLTKQNKSIKKILYIKLTIILSPGLCSYFV